LVKEYLWINILKNEKKETQKRNDTSKKIRGEEEPIKQAQADRNETLGSYARGNPGQKTRGPEAKCTKTIAKSIKKKRKRRSPGKPSVPSRTVLGYLI
jgi:hypothetical protein